MSRERHRYTRTVDRRQEHPAAYIRAFGDEFVSREGGLGLEKARGEP